MLSFCPSDKPKPITLFDMLQMQSNAMRGIDVLPKNFGKEIPKGRSRSVRSSGSDPC
jgi:hypothetical protein